MSINFGPAPIPDSHMPLLGVNKDSRFFSVPMSFLIDFESKAIMLFGRTLARIAQHRGGLTAAEVLRLVRPAGSQPPENLADAILYEELTFWEKFGPSQHHDASLAEVAPRPPVDPRKWLNPQQLAMVENFEAQIAEYQAKVKSLFDAIKHGDEAHEAWLDTAIKAHFAGRPLPEYVAAAKPAPQKFCRACVTERPGDVCHKCGEELIVPHRGWQEQALPDVEQIRTLARGVGYAIGEHGSRERDLDIIAAPWTDEAIDPRDLLWHLASQLNAKVVEVEEKPMGRLAATIQMDGWYKPIDISICPRAKPDRVFPVETLANAPVPSQRPVALKLLGWRMDWSPEGGSIGNTRWVGADDHKRKDRLVEHGGVAVELYGDPAKVPSSGPTPWPEIGKDYVHHPDEPFFVLLGRDPQAPDLVNHWAAVRNLAEPGDWKVGEARQIAQDMQMYKLGHPGIGMASELLDNAPRLNQVVSLKQCPNCHYILKGCRCTANTAKMLAAAASGNAPEVALPLALGITDSDPCPGCQYIHTHCRCEEKKSLKSLYSIERALLGTEK